MSALTVSATAWVPVEPTLNPKYSKPYFFDWTVCAEVSVSTDSGEGLSKLPKSKWDLHVMFADGETSMPAFTVTDLSSNVNAKGFYLVELKPYPHVALIRPTAIGVAVRRVSRAALKDDDRGEVVAPVFLAFQSVELSGA